MADNRIGQRLVRAGVIGDDQLDIALNEQQRTGDRIGVVMRRLNLAARGESLIQSD